MFEKMGEGGCGQGFKTSAPLVLAVQGSKGILGEEVSIFYIFLYISGRKFAILFLLWYGETKYICSPGGGEGIMPTIEAWTLPGDASVTPGGKQAQPA